MNDRLATIYDGENLEPQHRTLKDGEKDHRFVYQDETAAHANDYQTDYWLLPGQTVLKKKERGRLLMVSGFICEEIGLLQLTEEGKKRNAQLPESE